MWMITSILHFLASIFFPTYCFGCRKEGAYDEAMCEMCLKKCTRSVDTPFPYIVSIYSFRDPLIKKAVHSIKYFHRKDLIRPFAKVLAQELPIDEIKDAILIPIPMPKLRQYMRGYNHAEVLAHEISNITGHLVKPDIVTRNPQQKRKRQVTVRSRAERLKNQHNTFLVTHDLTGMNIIIVDDVTTTGATIQEARTLLLKQGAVSVRAITIAH